MKRREVENDAFYKGKKVLPDHLQLAGRRPASPLRANARVPVYRKPLKQKQGDLSASKAGQHPGEQLSQPELQRLAELAMK